MSFRWRGNPLQSFGRYRIAIGPHSGGRTLTLHDPALVRTGKPVKVLTTNRDGFVLNVAVACQHYQRGR
jgi:hypothetical protein